MVASLANPDIEMIVSQKESRKKNSIQDWEFMKD